MTLEELIARMEEILDGDEQQLVEHLAALLTARSTDSELEAELAYLEKVVTARRTAMAERKREALVERLHEHYLECPEALGQMAKAYLEGLDDHGLAKELKFVQEEHEALLDFDREDR